MEKYEKKTLLLGLSMMFVILIPIGYAFGTAEGSGAMGSYYLVLLVVLAALIGITVVSIKRGD